MLEIKKPWPLGHLSKTTSPSYSWRSHKKGKAFHTSCILTIRLMVGGRNPAFTSWYGKYPIFLQGFIHPRWLALGFLPSTVTVTKCFSRAPSSSMLSSSSGISTSFQDMWASWIEPASLRSDSYTSACIYMGVSKNGGTPKSSILIGFSIINQPVWGTSIFGNTHMYVCMHACMCRICILGMQLELHNSHTHMTYTLWI